MTSAIDIATLPSDADKVSAFFAEPSLGFTDCSDSMKAATLGTYAARLRVELIDAKAVDTLERPTTTTIAVNVLFISNPPRYRKLGKPYWSNKRRENVVSRVCDDSRECPGRGKDASSGRIRREYAFRDLNSGELSRHVPRHQI